MKVTGDPTVDPAHYFSGTVDNLKMKEKGRERETERQRNRETHAHKESYLYLSGPVRGGLGRAR